MTARSSNISFRVSTEERNKIKAQADAVGMNVSDYARWSALGPEAQPVHSHSYVTTHNHAVVANNLVAPQYDAKLAALATAVESVAPTDPDIQKALRFVRGEED